MSSSFPRQNEAFRRHDDKNVSFRLILLHVLQNRDTVVGKAGLTFDFTE